MTEVELGYADAVAELARILAVLDDDSIDVDILADQVARAAELITLCRDRINAARLKVDRVVADLDESPADRSLADESESADG